MADAPDKTSSQPDENGIIEPFLRQGPSRQNGSEPIRPESGFPAMDWAAFPLLSGIDSPADLKRLDAAQLKALAEEIRLAGQRLAKTD